MSRECPYGECLLVRCRHCLPKNASSKMRERGGGPGSMRFWLREWKKAEQRLKTAKAELRSARSKVLGYRRRGGTSQKRTIWLNAQLYAATEEVRLARNNMQKKKDSFASVSRWMLDGKVTREVR